MIRAFRSEWHKLIRRSMLLSAVLGVGVSGLATFLALSRAKSGVSEGGFSIATLSLSDGWSQIMSRASDLMGVVVLGIAAVAVASEYTNGTLRNLLVREPRRVRLLAGKSLSVLSFLAFLVVAACAVSLVTALVVAPGKGVDTSTWGTSAGVHSIVVTVVDVVVSALAYAVVGGVLALVLRSAAAAITVGFAWLVIVEALIVAGWSQTAQWLPGRLFNTIASNGSNTIAYGHAAVFAALYVAVAAIAGAVLFRTRDVTV
jgi:ABC-2 type transport system permease protein